MKINYPLKKHFKNYFIFYLLAALAIPFGATYLIRYKTRAKDYQTYSVFIGAEIINQSGLKKCINDILVDDLEIHTYYASENDSMYSTVLSTNGKLCDLIILSKEKAMEYTVSALLDVSECSFLPMNNAFEVEGRKYGISIKNNDEFLFNSYVTYTSNDYYAFVNPDSVHTLEFKKDGKTNQTATLLKRMFEI